MRGRPLARLRRADAASLSLDVLVLSAFAADGDVTAGGDARSDLSNEPAVPDANAPVHYTDYGIGVTPTGTGKAEATGRLRPCRPRGVSTPRRPTS